MLEAIITEKDNHYYLYMQEENGNKRNLSSGIKDKIQISKTIKLYIKYNLQKACMNVITAEVRYVKFNQNLIFG